MTKNKRVAPHPGLLLRRLVFGDAVEFGVDTSDWDEVLVEAVHALEEKGFITSKQVLHSGRTWVQGKTWIYEITGAGRDLIVEMDLDPRSTLANHLGSGRASSGDRAMWVWLLARGGVVSTYGVVPEANVGFLHVLACGLDLDASESPRDDIWNVFAGTFAEEDDRRVGVGGQAICQCGRIGPNKERSYQEDHDLGLDYQGFLPIRAEVESITALLSQIL